MKTTAEGVPWQSIIITVSPAVRAATAAYIWRMGTAILIDLGVSLRRITTALKALSLTLEDISAVVLTHEHIDHVKGLPMFLKKAKAPVFATRGTAEAFEEKNPEYADRLNIFDSGERFWVRDVDVVPFPTPHDAAESTGYIFEHGGSPVRLCDRPWLCARAMRPSFCAAVKWSCWRATMTRTCCRPVRTRIRLRCALPDRAGTCPIRTVRYLQRIW